MKQATLRAQIRTLCCLGLPAETLMPRLLPKLRQLVPADSAGFFWVDSVGHMQNLYAERMLPADKMKLYFAEHYDGREYPFQRAFLARAKKTETVSSGSADQAFERSAYYNEILRELDAHHVLYGVVREAGSALGQVSLYRSRKLAAFGAQDRAEINSILRYVGHAVAAPAGIHLVEADAAPRHDQAEEAIAIVDHDAHIIHASDLARRLLVQAANGLFAAPSLGDAEGKAENIVRRLVVDLDAAGDTPPVMTLDTRWGRLQLRAYHLADGRDARAPIAIRIARQEPLLLKLADGIQALELPAQQQEIALHLARGHPNGQIAIEMGLSPNTVAYHIKQIFMRLSAHSRAEAVAQMLAAAR